MNDTAKDPQTAPIMAQPVRQLWRPHYWAWLLVLASAGAALWYFTPTPAPVIATTERTPLALAGTPVPQPQAPITAATLGQLTKLAQLRPNFPAQSALSHNGRWLAMLAEDGVTIYDSLTFQPVRHLPMRYAARFGQVAITDDGQTVAVADRLDWHLWLPNGELRRLPLPAENDPWVSGLTLTPTGMHLAATLGNGAFLRWRVRDGALVEQGKLDDTLLAYQGGNWRNQALLSADGYGRVRYRIGNQTILGGAGVGAASTTDGAQRQPWCTAASTAVATVGEQ